MKLKHKLAEIAGTLKTNIRPIILFEMWFRIMTTAGLLPLLSLMFRLTLKAAGLPYLGNETVWAYVTSPATWVAVLIGLALLTFVTMTEVFGVITAIHASRDGQRMSVTQIMRAGMDQARRVLAPRNLFVALFTLLLLPFTSIVPMMGLVESIHLPGFTMDFIMANRLYLALFTLASLVILILVLDRIFLLHVFALRGEDVGSANGTALKLMRRYRLRAFLRLFVHEMLLGVAILLIDVILAAIAMGVIHLAATPAMRHGYALTVVSAITVCVSGLFTLISPILGFVEIGEMYYQRCEASDMPSAARRPDYPSATRRIRLALIVAVIVPFAAAMLAAKDGTTDIRPALGIEVAAHRGYSTIYPENNMPAFQGAIDCGADWIELDVHQTKDGVIVVTHDASIDRIAGVGKNVYDLTFEELESYDVGSWFSPAFAGLRVATLDEVIKLCKGKIRIQIELKPTGHETAFEQAVIDIVRANDYADECYLASMDVPCLKRIRELAPEMKTLYIAVAAVGDMTAADFADGLSVEETNVTAELVAEMHRAGKPVYVWTINDPESVAYLIECNVDGILSDDPVMLRKALKRGGMNEELVEILDLIYGEDSYAAPSGERAAAEP